MKRFYKFLMPLVAIVAMALPVRVTAQDTVTIGTGTSTSYYIPFNSLYGYSFTEQIYQASDIDMAGQITAVQFYLAQSYTSAQTNTITLYMKNVTRSTFSSSSDVEPVTANDVVFTGSWTIPANYIGWVTIELDTPFEYDGASNLMVAMHESTSGYSTRYFTYTSVTNATLQYYSDSYNPDPYNPTSYSGSKTTRSYLANMRLAITTGTITCNRVRNLTATDIAPWSCTLNWVDTLNSGASYTVITMPDSTLMASGISDTTVSITGLTPDHNYVFGVIADCGGGDESRATTVNVHTLVSCPPPTALTVDSVTTSDISLHWTPGYQEAEWYLSIGDSLIGSVTDTSYTISDLNANTVYTIYLRAVCGADDSSVVVSTHTRTLPGEPVNVFPYTCDFEDADENAGWVLENGSQPNAWYIGTAVNNGGTQSLYVSNNNGTSNAYGNDMSSHVYAYRYINFSDTGSYVFSFDWHCQGESNYYDYLRAWLSPASVIHEAGDGTTYNYSTLAVPGCIDLVGANSNGQYTLAGSSNFTTHAGEFRISTPGTYKLVFLWSNDGSGGSNPPAAVDNVFINTNSCPAPYNLVATYVGSDTIELSWAAGGEETSWLVTVNGGTPESVSSNTLTLDGLNSNTAYNINVQAECGGDDVSIPASLSVRTACGTINLPFSEDFTGMASSSYPDCWTRVMSGSYPYITTSYGNSIQFAGTAAVIAPYIAAPLNQMIVSFDLRKEGSSSGSMTFGYTSDPVAASDMVVLHTIDPSTTATYFNYEYDLSLDSAVANLDPDSVYYLVWRQNGSTSWYYWLDNVNIEQYNPCTKPQNFTCTSTQPDSVVVTWNAGDASSWELYVGPAGVPVNEDSAFAVNDSVYVFTNLQGGVAYNFYVRTDCGGDYSNWAGPLAVTPGQYIIGTSGSASITMCGGVIYDDGGATGQYSNNADYTLTIAPSHPDSMLTFQGWAYTESSIDYLRIYEGTSPSGTILWQTSTSSQLDNIPYTIVTSGPITLKWHTDGSVVYDGFELQIGCMAAPDCSPVDNLTVHPTPTAALVTWQPGYYGNYTGADIEYKADTADTWISLPAVTGTYAVITGLDPLTDYNVRVTTDCEGFPGGVATANFTTKQFPCEVEDTTLSATGTIGTGTSETTGVPVNSAWGNTMCQSIYLASELTALGMGNTITAITYTWTNNSSYAKEFSIYMTNTSASEFTGASTSNWMPTGASALVYNGPHPTGTSGSVTYQLTTPFVWDGSSNICITTTMNQPAGASHSSSGFYGKSTETSPQAYRSMYKYQDSNPIDGSNPASVSPSSRSYYRPNITLSSSGCSQYGTCAAPAVAVVDVTTNTATLAWAPGNTETSWNLYYRMAGDATWSAPIAVTGNNYIVTGLNQGRHYEFKLESTCSGDTYATTADATTLCAQISSLPFTENFNGWGTGVTPNCWSNQAGYSPTSYGIISSSYNCSGSTGGSIYMYSSSGTSVTYLALPELDTTVYQPNQLQLVFNLFYNSTSYSAPQVEVGVMTSQENSASFVPVDTVTHSGALSTWEVFEVPLTSYTGNGSYVAIRTNYPGTYSYFYLDDVTLEQIPTCPRPDSLTASNATTSSVDCGWHERGNATSWIIEYGPRGFQLGTGTTVVATSNPFTLTGLPSSYQGEYYVKSVCGAGDTGEYSRMGCAFGTTQIPATLPYNYDFEDPAEWANWQTSTNHETINWYRGTSVADSSNYSIYVASGDTASYYGYSFNAVVNAAAYRDIDFGPVDSSYTISFSARAGGTTDARYDAMMVFLVDPSLPTIASTSNITSPWGNVNDLYRIATIYLDTNWTTYEASFDTISGIQRVAFFWFNQNTGASYTNIPQPAAVDNIHIAYSSCPRPVALEAVPSTTSALLTWVGPASATYEITYRKVGDTVNSTIIANTNNFTLTGLVSPAEYRVWVRKLCGADTSLYSDGVAFTTLCSPINLPYVEDFNSVTATTYSTAGSLPLCWEGFSNGTSDAYFPHVVAAGGSYAYSNDNTNSLTLTSGTSTYGDTKIVALPILNADLSTCMMSFYYRMESTSYGDLEVGYLTGYDLENDFVPVDTMPRTSTITLDSVSFAGIPSTALRLGFRWTHDASYYSVGIDNITVTGTGSVMCDAPAIDAAFAGETTATLNWTGSAANYEVAYVEGTWVEPTAGTPATGLTHTFTGLTAGTQYSVGVRAVCGDENYSDWAVTTITTAEHPCYAPTGVAATNITLSGATIAWTPAEEGQTNFELRYSTAGDTTVVNVTENPYTLTGLLNATEYSVAVRAICGEGNYSDWSTPATFTTASCQMVQGVNVPTATITSSSAVVNWTANGSSSYEVGYGPLGTTTDNCTRRTTTTNSYTITGLEEGTNYVVYVRSICGDGIYSDWTAGFNFMTTEVGIDDVDNTAISLYPNPASSTVTLTGIEGEATVTVVDMNGRVVKVIGYGLEVIDNSLTIDISELAQGAYFVRITGERVNAIRKLIVR